MELLSQMWSLLGLLTVLQNVLPSQLLFLLHSLWQSFQDWLTPYSYYDVPEFLGSSAVEPNDLYRHIHLYIHHSLLSSSPSRAVSTLPRLTLSRPRGAARDAMPCLSLSPNHAVEDCFVGQRLLWAHHVDTLQDSLEERRAFSLRLPKRHPSLLRPYLAHVSSAAESLARASRQRRLHTNAGRGGGGSSCESSAWASVPFRHPATFDTLALDPEMKQFLISDLDAFAAGGEFYQRTGRAWKRGYLLHGPPGSGKSSLVAAIANHLHYDVYDLELTRVADNSELRALLIQTTNRSVIVIEDIDCSLDLTADRTNKARRKLHKNIQKLDDDLDDDDDDTNCNSKVTLSGLLNFTDGLWSCCGEERIIIFTTNYKEGLDPALLRPGRMDVHVKLGPCGVAAVRELLERYIGLEDHELLEAVEGCVRAGGGMTVAEVGEVLLRSREDAQAAVRELVAELQARAGGGGESSEGSEEEGTSLEKGWESVVPGKRGKGKRARWEGKVRLLGRLRSLTKSDSGRRGV